MSKSDWVWLAIRVFGLYLLVRTAVAVAKILYAGLAYVSPGGWSEEYTEYFQSSLFDGIGSAVIYGACGLHLVTGGAWLHKLLMKTGTNENAA